MDGEPAVSQWDTSCKSDQNEAGSRGCDGSVAEVNEKLCGHTQVAAGRPRGACGVGDESIESDRCAGRMSAKARVCVA